MAGMSKYPSRNCGRINYTIRLGGSKRIRSAEYASTGHAQTTKLRGRMDRSTIAFRFARLNSLRGPPPSEWRYPATDPPPASSSDHFRVPAASTGAPDPPRAAYPRSSNGNNWAQRSRVGDSNLPRGSPGPGDPTPSAESESCPLHPASRPYARLPDRLGYCSSSAGLVPGGAQLLVSYSRSWDWAEDKETSLEGRADPWLILRSARLEPPDRVVSQATDVEAASRREVASGLDLPAATRFAVYRPSRSGILQETAADARLLFLPQHRHAVQPARRRRPLWLVGSLLVCRCSMPLREPGGFYRERRRDVDRSAPVGGISAGCDSSRDCSARTSGIGRRAARGSLKPRRSARTLPAWLTPRKNLGPVSSRMGCRALARPSWGAFS